MAEKKTIPYHAHETCDEESDKEIEEDTIKRSKAQDTSLAPSRFGSANAEGGYVNRGSYVSGFINKPEKRTSKAGYHAVAGDPAEHSVLKAEAKDDEEMDLVRYKKLPRSKKQSKIKGKVKVSSDLNKKLLKKETWKVKTIKNKKPSVQLLSAHIDIIDTVNIIDTIDRRANATTEGIYARAGEYVHGFTNKPGKRIPKAGYSAEAGVGRARAEFSVFEAEAKGPNASIGAEASVLGVGAMARAEVASASAKAGPIGVKVGLGFDTGASIGWGGAEAKFLGIGVSIGPKTSVSVLGSEVSCSVM